MNKNILAAFGVGALLAGGGAFLVMSNNKPAPLEITSRTTEQALKTEPVAPTPVVEEPRSPEATPPPRAPKSTAAKRPTQQLAATTRAQQPVPAAVVQPPVQPPATPAPVTQAAPEAAKSVIHGEAKPAPEVVEIRKPDPIAEEARRKQREPATVTNPVGTQIVVRLQETLAADKMQTGDTFHATLDAPLEVAGFVLAERGARAVGRIVESDRAGRVRGVSRLAIELTQFTTSDGQTVLVQSETFNREGATSKKSDAAKVGAGAAVGAALGAIFGGGKGAAIGGAAGAGAGGGTVLMTRGKPAVIEVETRIPFQTKAAVAVTEKLR